MSEKEKKKETPEHSHEISIETATEQIENLLNGDYTFSKRAIALLLLQEDQEIEALVKSNDSENFDKIKNIIQETEKHYSHPLDYIIAMRRQQEVNQIIAQVTEPVEAGKFSFQEKLSQITMYPITGLAILFLVIYWGLYKFVGEFGAGTLVDFLEGTVFEVYINPYVTKFFHAAIPWQPLQELFVGDYGVITLGARYAIAIILPIVTIFFIVFSVIEDTGYLPSLAMLIDRIFKKFGLSGRAVIPIVLGFGCATMGTMVTRTLSTKRERLIATMLLALAVPCSAQLGVIIALLEGHKLAVLIWATVISLVFFFVGYLGSKILPGERPTFYMEVPLLRLPKLSNVFVKTYTRVQWYLKEVIPLFMAASVFIWLGQITGLFKIFINLLKTPVKLIGLPPETAQIFLFGFFRRDYGAAGLYDLNKTNILTGRELVVACIALTLFLPCMAELLMNIKERGIKTGSAIAAITLLLSFTVAFAVNYILIAININL